MPSAAADFLVSAGWIEALVSGGPVLTDGAWGTQLQGCGLGPGECPDGWNLSHPDAVAGVARGYAEAGSRVVLTNTFGANRLRLREAGLDGRLEEINRLGVQLSRRGAGEGVKVFASMGPTGKLLMSGETTPGELEAVFGEQARVLAAAGADALVVETMSDPAEAALAVEAGRSTGLPVVGCLVFDSGRDGDRTMMGTTVEQGVAALTTAGADVIGANCGQGIAGFVSICRRFRASTSRPIWIKANAGLPEMVEGRAVYRTTPEEFARYGGALKEAGASFIGGCCGTSPEFIRALAARL